MPWCLCWVHLQWDKVEHTAQGELLLFHGVVFQWLHPEHPFPLSALTPVEPTVALQAVHNDSAIRFAFHFLPAQAAAATAALLGLALVIFFALKERWFKFVSCLLCCYPGFVHHLSGLVPSSCSELQQLSYRLQQHCAVGVAFPCSFLTSVLEVCTLPLEIPGSHFNLM